ncbi:hypothetical protein EVAR_91346_1 [Eumeta japonica]|uniref:Uncharacterized protein n=1 Tax=Eumeta variegata TaxID=151549 RepID=A0A4C1TKM0_EUMVA|nr:hypothetical protein EVAR_91346_1 [Eumeta japonica]
MALNNLKLFELFRKSITPTCFAEAALEELDSLYGNIERSKSIKNKLCMIHAKIKAKWVICNRTINIFNSKYEDWLNEDTILDILAVDKTSTSTREKEGKKYGGVFNFHKKRKLADSTNDHHNGIVKELGRRLQNLLLMQAHFD